MDTAQALVVFFLMLVAGWILFLVAMYVARRLTKKNISVRSLFIGFRKKMWMTVGLGLIFTAVYLSIGMLGRLAFNSEWRLNLFHSVYKNPTAFIYFGLFIFACITTGIYLARMLIIHLYNTRNRD